MNSQSRKEYEFERRLSHCCDWRWTERCCSRRFSWRLDREVDKVADTIQSYQKGKHVMAEPGILPLRSDVPFEQGPVRIFSKAGRML